MAGPIAVIAFAAAVAIGLAVFGGPVVLAILPLVAGVGVLALLQVLKRREAAQGMTKFREEADPHKTEFTARDRESQV